MFHVEPKRKRASVLAGGGPEEPAGASGVTAYVPRPGDVTGFIDNPNDLLSEERFRAARAVVPRNDLS